MLKYSGWLFDTTVLTYEVKKEYLHIWGYPIVVLDLEVFKMMQDEVNKLELTLLEQIEQYKHNNKNKDLNQNLEVNYGMYKSYIRNVVTLETKHYQKIGEFMFNTFYVDMYK